MMLTNPGLSLARENRDFTLGRPGPLNVMSRGEAGMTPVQFRPEDFFDSWLCDALDRMAREAGVIDVYGNPTIPGSYWKYQKPTDEEPWLFITSHRLHPAVRAANHDDDPESLNMFLRSHPGVDEEHAAVLKQRQEEADAHVQAMEAFEDIITPLFEALRDGKIFASGFRRTIIRAVSEDEPQEAVVSNVEERIPLKFWSRQWLLSRDASAVVLEFHDGKTNCFTNPIASFGMVGLVAPLPSERPAVIPAVESAGMTDLAANKRAVRGRSTDDEPYFTMIENLLRNGYVHKMVKSPVLPWGAAKILVDVEKIVPLDGSQPDSVIKRIVNGYKKTARPQTAADARRNTQVTQK